MRLGRMLDDWCRGQNDCLHVGELVEMIKSVVPKDVLSRYRSLRSMGQMLARIGYKMNAELNSNALREVLEYIMEVSVYT